MNSNATPMRQPGSLAPAQRAGAHRAVTHSSPTTSGYQYGSLGLTRKREGKASGEKARKRTQRGHKQVMYLLQDHSFSGLGWLGGSIWGKTLTNGQTQKRQ